MWRIGHSHVGSSELFSCGEVEGGQAILLNRERRTDCIFGCYGSCYFRYVIISI